MKTAPFPFQNLLDVGRKGSRTPNPSECTRCLPPCLGTYQRLPFRIGLHIAAHRPRHQVSIKNYVLFDKTIVKLGTYKRTASDKPHILTP